MKDRGDIYWIQKTRWGDTDGSCQEAGRPAVIVSNHQNNQHSDTLEIVYLTTAPKKDLPTHVTIRSAIEVSTALCEQITTISEDRIGNYIGKATKEEMEALENAMLISLGIETTQSEPLHYQIVDEQKDLASDLERERNNTLFYKRAYEELLERIMSK